MKRSLRLRRDSLDELTVDELGGVDGAAATLKDLCDGGITQPCTLGYQTCRGCITHPPCTI